MRYARVLNTTIILENKSFKKEITVDQEGFYEVEVPAGTYLVKAQGPGSRQSRVKIAILPDATRTLNIMLEYLPQKPVRCPKGALCL